MWERDSSPTIGSTDEVRNEVRTECRSREYIGKPTSTSHYKAGNKTKSSILFGLGNHCWRGLLSKQPTCFLSSDFQNAVMLETILLIKFFFFFKPLPLLKEETYFMHTSQLLFILCSSTVGSYGSLK